MTHRDSPSPSHHYAQQWSQWLDQNSKRITEYRSETTHNDEFHYFEFNEMPILLDHAIHREMQYQTQMLSELISTIATMCILNKLDLDDKPLAEWLEIPNHVMYWVRKFHSPGRRFLWGRPDFHISQGQPQCLELNIASAAGYQMQSGSIASYFEDHPALNSVFSGTDPLILDPLEGFISLLGGVVRSGETVLLADVRESNRYSQHIEAPYAGMTRLIKSLSDLRLNGAFIEDLDLRNDGVYQSGQRIDKIFMSYYNPHDFTRFGDFLPLWHLHEKGVVQCLDSLDEILLSNKILFAFASEFAESLPISTALKRFVHTSVPWTRIVRQTKALYHGQTQDLWDIALERQSDMVLKKAQSAEGKDVYIGSWTQANHWRDVLDHAFSSGGWILQEFAAPDEVPLKLWSPGSTSVDGKKTLELKDEGNAFVTMSPYSAQGVSVGYCVRHYQPPKNIENPDRPQSAKPVASVNQFSLKPFGGVIIV